MPHPLTEPFGAQAACPSPDKLSAYKEDALSFIAREHVRLHLASCDFCGAALQLLSTQSRSAKAPCAPPSPARMPLRILLLAARLLPAAQSDASARARRVA